MAGRSSDVPHAALGQRGQASVFQPGGRRERRPKGSGDSGPVIRRGRLLRIQLGGTCADTNGSGSRRAGLPRSRPRRRLRSSGRARRVEGPAARCSGPGTYPSPSMFAGPGVFARSTDPPQPGGTPMAAAGKLQFRAMEAAFTTEQVMRITGVSRRRLTYWLERGVIGAETEVMRGRRHIRVWSFRNLVEVRVALWLRERAAVAWEDRHKVAIPRT